MSKIVPLGDKVLLKSIESKEEQINGIYIPDSAKEKPQESEVIAIGTGGLDSNGNEIKFYVKQGDKVLTTQYGGSTVKVDGQEYKLVSQSDILAIVKN